MFMYSSLCSCDGVHIHFAPGEWEFCCSSSRELAEVFYYSSRELAEVFIPPPVSLLRCFISLYWLAVPVCMLGGVLHGSFLFGCHLMCFCLLQWT